MSEREAFHRAIAAAPNDDVPRLAFADWLDEHDDPDRAEFIRVQCRLGSANRKAPRYAKLVAREKALYDAHEAEWLGPLKAAEKKYTFYPEFRRGFVHSALIHGSVLADYADALREYCPVLDELEVLGVRGHGERIAAACPPAVRTLRLEDWPYPDDAAALVDSPHLGRLETLSLWLGSDDDPVVCGTLGLPRKLPALRRAELIQLYGGLQAGVDAETLATQADYAARAFNAPRGQSVAVVDRPFEQLMPLAESVGRNLFGGHLPDGRQALAHGRRQTELYYFDREGNLLSGEVFDLSGVLRRQPDYEWKDYHAEELIQVLGERIGFKPGMIWVHEFDGAQVVPDSFIGVYKFGGSCFPLMENPDNPERYELEHWEEELDSIRYWLRSDNFCIGYGDECWTDERGIIHTT